MSPLKPMVTECAVEVLDEKGRDRKIFISFDFLDVLIIFLFWPFFLFPDEKVEEYFIGDVDSEPVDLAQYEELWFPSVVEPESIRESSADTLGDTMQGLVIADDADEEEDEEANQVAEQSRSAKEYNTEITNRLNQKENECREKDLQILQLINDFSETIATVDGEVDAKNRELEKANLKLVQIERVNERISDELKKLQKQNAEYESQIDENNGVNKETQVEILKGDINKLQNKMGIIASERDSLREMYNSSEDKFGSVKAELEKVQAELDHMKLNNPVDIINSSCRLPEDTNADGNFKASSTTKPIAFGDAVNDGCFGAVERTPRNCCYDDNDAFTAAVVAAGGSDGYTCQSALWDGACGILPRAESVTDAVADLAADWCSKSCDTCHPKVPEPYVPEGSSDTNFGQTSVTVEQPPVVVPDSYGWEICTAPFSNAPRSVGAENDASMWASWHPERWAEVAGYFPGHNIPVSQHPDPAVRDNACEVDVDFGHNEEALCISYSDCMDLAWNLNEVSSVEYHHDSGRCWFNSWDVVGGGGTNGDAIWNPASTSRSSNWGQILHSDSFSADSGFTTSVKRMHCDLECQQGGLNVSFTANGEDRLLFRTDMHIWDQSMASDSDFGTLRMRWNQCMWTVWEKVPPEGMTFSSADDICDDRDAAAYWFGETCMDSTSISASSACADGAALGFCSDSNVFWRREVFRTLCPDSCAVPAPCPAYYDHDDLAALIADDLGYTNVKNCGDLCLLLGEGPDVLSGSGDKVVEAICPATCGNPANDGPLLHRGLHSRLLSDAFVGGGNLALDIFYHPACASENTRADLDRAFPNFSRFCPKPAGPFMDKSFELDGDDNGDHRWIRRYVSSFTSWENYFTDNCDSSIEYQEAINAGTPILPENVNIDFCDVSTLQAPTSFELDWKCNIELLSNPDTQAICSGENMNIEARLVDDLSQHLCSKKCNAGSDDPHCIGYLAGLATDPQAADAASSLLCLPRAACEFMCSAIDDCGSVDMHQIYPQCYLNNKCDNCDSSSGSSIVHGAGAGEFYLIEKVNMIEENKCAPVLSHNGIGEDEADLASVLGGSPNFLGEYSEVQEDGSYRKLGGDGGWMTFGGFGYCELQFWVMPDAPALTLTLNPAGDCSSTPEWYRGALFRTSCPTSTDISAHRVCEKHIGCPATSRCTLPDHSSEPQFAYSASVGSCDLFEHDVGGVDTELLAKQVATSSLSQALIDASGSHYDPSYYHGQEFFVDSSDAIKVRISSLNADRAWVTVGNTASGVSSALLPDGTTLTSTQVTVVRGNVGHADCFTGAGYTLQFKAPSGSEAIVGVIWSRAGSAQYLPGLGGELHGHSRDGWVEVNVPTMPNVVGDYVDSFTVVLDDNECSASPCHSNAICTNKFAGYECNCAAGYAGDGTNTCIQVSSDDCYGAVVRVYNSEATKYGWRVNNVELFHGDSCDAGDRLPYAFSTSNNDMGDASSGGFTTGNAWRSNCLLCQPGEAWFEFTVQTCSVGAVTVDQDGRFPAVPYHVTVTLQTTASTATGLNLPEYRGVRYGGHHVTEVWKYGPDSDSCSVLPVGRQGRLKPANVHGDMISYSTAAINALHCQQICMDTADCSFYQYGAHYAEDDQKECTLYSGDGVSAGDATQHPDYSNYVFGDVGALVQPVAISASFASPFAVTITVRGVTCPSGIACAAPPASHSHGSLTWKNVEITGKLNSADYTVCFSAEQSEWFMAVGTITVSGSGHYWDTGSGTEFAAADGVGLQSVTLTVTKPIVAYQQAMGDLPEVSERAEYWAVKMVASTVGHCDGAGAVVTPESDSVPADGSSAVFVFDDVISAGSQHFFCLCTKVTNSYGENDDQLSTCNFKPISNVDGEKMLKVYDASAPECGAYPNQRFSARNGLEFTAFIQGANFLPDGSFEVLRMMSGTCDNPTHQYAEFNYLKELSNSSHSVFSSIGVMDAPPGTYNLCIWAAVNTDCAVTSPANAGTVVVTDRFDINRLFVVDSPGSPVDLHLTGSNLDPDLDRVMIVNTNVPCGGLAISPSPSWNFSGPAWHWLPTKTFSAPVVEEVDQEADGIIFSEAKGRYCAQYADLAMHGDSCQDGDDETFADPDGALCVDLDGCRAHCTADENCVAFSHTRIDSFERCYIHTAGDGCVEQLESGGLVQEDRFNFWTKRELRPYMNRTTITRTESITQIHTVVTGGRRLSGINAASTLTFPGLQVDHRGQYKVCGCDHTIATHGRCGSVLDFTVEVGRLSIADRSCVLPPTYYTARGYDSDASVWAPQGNCLSMGPGASVCGDYFTVN
eukprot:gene725-133_t